MKFSALAILSMSGLSSNALDTSRSILIISLDIVLARFSSDLQNMVSVPILSTTPSSICLMTMKIKNPITIDPAIGAPTSPIRPNISSIRLFMQIH